MLALNHLGMFAAIVFILGLVAATFSSADSVLTTLTTSFYIDVLHADENPKYNEKKRTQLRHIIHIAFAVLLLLVILLFKWLNQDAIINTVLTVAGYTYGPLLGLFAFGLLTKRIAQDKAVPIICLITPVVCFILSTYSKEWFGGYSFGHELLLLNGLFTFAGLWLFIRSQGFGYLVKVKSAKWR